MGRFLEVAFSTITGQTYSPDFMFVVKKENGEKILNIIVETIDVEISLHYEELKNPK